MITRNDWEPGLNSEGKTAIIKCSACRHRFQLDGYSISDDGIVKPTVHCPKCKAWNDEIRLAGWPWQLDPF